MSTSARLRRATDALGSFASRRNAGFLALIVAGVLIEIGIVLAIVSSIDAAQTLDRNAMLLDDRMGVETAVATLNHSVESLDTGGRADQIADDVANVRLKVSNLLDRARIIDPVRRSLALENAVSELERTLAAIDAIGAQYAGQPGVVPPQETLATLDDLRDQAASYARQISTTLDGTQVQQNAKAIVAQKVASVTLLVAGLLLPLVSGLAVLALMRRTNRQREESLRQVQIRDRALAAVPDGILITDATLADHPVVFANPSFSAITGWPLDEILGRRSPLAVVAGDGDGDGEEIRELDVPRRDGTTFPCHLGVAAVRDEDGVVTHRVWTVQDITPRRETEDALRRSEEYHRTLTENSTDITAILDATGRCTYVSPSVARVLGYPVEHYLGRRPLLEVHPDDRLRLMAMWRRGVDSTGVDAFPGPVRYRMADGGWASLETTTRAFTDDKGRRLLVTNSRDVTARLRAEEALGEAQLRYRETLDTVQLAAISMDADARITYVNDRLLDITGYARGELLHRTLGEALLAPDDEEAAAQADERLRADMAAGMLPIAADVEVVTKLHERRLIGVSRTFVRDADGRILSVTSLGDDITERRDREEALRAASSRLATLVENLQAAVLVEDQRHHAVLANQAFCDTFGLPFSPQMIEGWPIPVIIDAIRSRFVDGEAFAHGVDTLSRRGEPATGDEVGFVDGRVFERDYLPIRHDGELLGHLWVYRDVTSRVRAADELRAARDAAEAANRAKGAFLATMSHEIRTPMNGVMTAANLMLDTDMTAEQREWAELIRQSGDSLLAIINDILDFSKIEAGRLDLEMIDFDLRQTIESAIELQAESAAARGLELISVVDPDIPTVLTGDPSRLRQVLLNFLSNALKFTERGEVVARVSLEDDGYDGTVLLRFSVRDTGIGIPQDTLQRLFRPFTQADGTMARRYGGTGLGLAICRQLAEMMGGTVGVTSTVGVGSTFWFTGRFDVSAAAVRTTLRHPAFDGLRALVLDDNATQREILGHQLRSWGLDVLTAATGHEALMLLRAAHAERRPVRMALIDETMPGADGFAIARRIKEEPAIAATRLVLLAAPGRRPIRMATAAVGIATYLRKPLRYSELHQALLNLTDNRTEVALVAPAPAVDGAGEEHLFTGARILVAEDNTVNARLAAAQLQRLGCRVDIAGDGVEVMEATRRAAYDLVLMDCQMPEIDGFEATRRIRQREIDEGLPRTRIIAMTANAMAGDRERCMEAGMDDYLAKPVRGEELREALRRQLLHPGRTLVGTTDEMGIGPSQAGERASQAGERASHAMAPSGLALTSRPEASGPAPSAPSGTALPAAPGAAGSSPVARSAPAVPGAPTGGVVRFDDPDSAPLIDEVTLQDVGILDEGGDGLLADLVRLFAAETPDLLARIADAIDADDVQAMQTAAHTVKGSAGTIGAARMYVLARRLDDLGKRGLADLKEGRAASVRDAAPMLARLDEAFPETLAAFRATLAGGPSRAAALAGAPNVTASGSANGAGSGLASGPGSPGAAAASGSSRPSPLATLVGSRADRTHAGPGTGDNDPSARLGIPPGDGTNGQVRA